MSWVESRSDEVELDELEQFERSRKCRLRACREPKSIGPLCDDHWDQLPDDLQVRLRWAYEEGSSTDRAAAFRAASEYIRDL